MTLESVLNPPKPAKPGEEPVEDIQVVESGKGLKMDDSTQKFGQAINAQLALFYIRKLWQTIEDNRIHDIVHDTEKIMLDLKSRFNNMPQEDKDFAEKAFDLIIANAQKALDWIVELLDHSAAITMDKNIILKTLSQSECEGLRFYLCMKDRPEEDKKVVGDNDPKKLTGGLREQKLTFVTVGVDRCGHDLEYKYPDGRPQSTAEQRIPDIEDCSLCSEYPYTSGMLCSKPFDDPGLKPYPLYKFAKTKKKP